MPGDADAAGEKLRASACRRKILLIGCLLVDAWTSSLE